MMNALLNPALHRSAVLNSEDLDPVTVLVLRTDGIHPASIGDDHLGGYLATRKLIGHGHTRIGLIVGPEYATTAVQRRAGYRAALTEAGIKLGRRLTRRRRLHHGSRRVRCPYPAIDLVLDETHYGNDEPRTIVATPTLIPRGSTAAPRTR